MEVTHKAPAALDHTEERRRQILRAAMACFARRGFHLTTMNDISAEAQISVGLIYRYFDSKDAVITFMAERAHGRPARAPGRRPVAPPPCSRRSSWSRSATAKSSPSRSTRVRRGPLRRGGAERAGPRLGPRRHAVFHRERHRPDRRLGRVPHVAAGAVAADGGRDHRRCDARHDDPRDRGFVTTLTATQIRERQLAMLRTLWPLLFSRHRARGARRTESAMKRKIIVAVIGIIVIVGDLGRREGDADPRAHQGGKRVRDSAGDRQRDRGQGRDRGSRCSRRSARSPRSRASSCGRSSRAPSARSRSIGRHGGRKARCSCASTRRPSRRSCARRSRGPSSRV